MRTDLVFTVPVAWVVVRMTGETDLLGNPVAPLKPRQEKRSPINDMDLVQRVLRLASTPGFVLVGGNERVYQRTTDSYVEKTPEQMDRAVHQLIEAKWLEVGGTHQVRYGRYQGPARSVLVPKKSRNAVSRWQALHCPGSWQKAG